MEKKANFATSYRKGVVIFRNIQEAELESYTKKVRALKDIKELYSSPVGYDIIAIVFIAIAVLMVKFVWNLKLSLEIKTLIPIFSITVAFFSLQIARKMRRIKRILGGDIKDFSQKLAKEIEALENSFYQGILLEKNNLATNLKDYLLEKDFPTDITDIFCWYLKKEMTKPFLKGPVNKKELFSRLASENLKRK